MPSTAPDGAPRRDDVATLLAEVVAVLVRLEKHLPSLPAAPDFSRPAMRWRKRDGRSFLQAVPSQNSLRFADLMHIDRQLMILQQNTQQFVEGRPANNVLLTGARGTGKSSLIKACLNEFAAQGLRLIEVDKADLVDLPDIVESIANRPERFIIYCDDLSFEEGESSYKALKVALDGTIAASSENVLVYATSNRRHLMPEQIRDNLSYVHQEDGEIHPGDVVEEKISLSERFGIWLSFYPFRQDEYLAIVAHWLEVLSPHAIAPETFREEALRWALQRGSRSGRVASQFARDWVGRNPSKAA